MSNDFDDAAKWRTLAPAAPNVKLTPAELAAARQAYGAMTAGQNSADVQLDGLDFHVVRRSSPAYAAAKANPRLLHANSDQLLDLASFVRIPDGAPPAKRRHVDSRASLADDFTNPRNMDMQDPWNAATAAQVVGQARRYVFDAAAANMAADLAALPGRQLAKLLDACEPASQTVWIEMPADGLFEHMPDAPRDFTGAKCAVLAQVKENHCTHIMLVHHMEPPMVRWWATGFMVSHEGAPFRKHVDTYSDTLQPCLWGVAYDPGPLHGRARLTLNHSVARHYQATGEGVKVPGGWTRFGIAALAILNSRTIEVSEPVRPSGGRLIGGRTRPYHSMTPLVLSLPGRVKKRVEYMARAVAAEHARRKLHEVRPHWRHLSRRPRAAGWQEIEIDGATWWRKRIDAHLRGDPDAGVVEHSHTVVHGRPQEGQP